RPVLFQSQIEAMHQAGARLFVEVGPRRVLSGLVDQTLGDLPHVSVPISGGGDDLSALLKALGQLAAEGVPLTLDPCFEGRGAGGLSSRSPPYPAPRPANLAPRTWMVDGGRVRRLREAGASPAPAPPARVGPDGPRSAPASSSHTPRPDDHPAQRADHAIT